MLMYILNRFGKLTNKLVYNKCLEFHFTSLFAFILSPSLFNGEHIH